MTTTPTLTLDDFQTADLGYSARDGGFRFDREAAYAAYAEAPEKWHGWRADDGSGPLDPIEAMVLSAGPWWVEDDRDEA